MTQRANCSFVEVIQPDEDSITMSIVAANVKTLSRQNGIAKRGQHSKHHGCVDAKFKVLPDIPDQLRIGVFSQPKTFEALIRFSNGKSVDDREPDAHGMAIKLFDVSGDKLVDDAGAEGQQDFVLVDHPIFFVKGLYEYETFSKHFGNLLGFKKNRKGLFPFVKSIFALKVVHRSLARRAKSFSQQTPISPLATNYWSSVPSLLGKTPVKYKIVSPKNGPGSQAGVSTENGLREALAHDLESRSIALTFGVLVQSDPKRQPVEDATVDWEENGSQFVELAKIEIPKQVVKVNDAQAENTVFSPWNGIEAHRPIGAVNRVRKTVYQEMSRRRHELNGVNTVMPQGVGQG
ncbi:MAG: catalase family protein [Pseudomonadota bacterium]